ncbi:MAG: hypothetical protein V4501_11895 [Pseudomonadota bacterium]
MSKPRTPAFQTDEHKHPNKTNFFEDEEKSPSAVTYAKVKQILEIDRLNNNDSTLLSIIVTNKSLKNRVLTKEEKNLFFSALSQNTIVKNLTLNYLKFDEDDILNLVKALKSRNIELESLFIQGTDISIKSAKALSTVPVNILSLRLSRIGDDAALSFVEKTSMVKEVDFSGANLSAPGLLKIINTNAATHKLDKASIATAFDGFVCTEEQRKSLRSKLDEMEKPGISNNLNIKR